MPCGRHHGPVEALDLYVAEVVDRVPDLADWLAPLASAEAIVCSCEPEWPCCHGLVLADLLDEHHPLPPLAEVIEFPSGRRIG